MDISIQANQKITAHVSGIDGAVPPNPVALTAVPVWSITSGDGIVSLTPSADGLSVDITSVALGTAVLTVTSGALTSSANITVIAVPVPVTEPAALVITFDDPAPI